MGPRRRSVAPARGDGHRTLRRTVVCLLGAAIVLAGTVGPIAAAEARTSARTAHAPIRPIPERPAAPPGLSSELAGLARDPIEPPPGLIVHRRGRDLGVAVSIHLAPSGPGAAAALRSTLGRLAATVLGTAPGLIEAEIPAAHLLELASSPGVRRVDPIRRPVATGIAGVGAVLHGADVWHAAGYSGEGVRIGIVDEGFDGIGGQLAARFPGGVQARCYTSPGTFSSSIAACENGEPHGTAVAETIADMAPAATLFVANPISFTDLQSTVAWMTGQGVKVINASFGSGDVFEGPGDGTSPYPDSLYGIVDQAVAAGALWVNAAGNSGDLGWSGPWTDANGDGWLDFSGSDQADRLVLDAGEHVAIAIRWDDPWGTAADDYDLYVFQAGGAQPIATSVDVQAGAGDPVERIDLTAPTSGSYDIQIAKHPAAAARRLQLLVEGATHSLTYQVPAGTLPSPADSRNPGMVSVGAVDVAAPDVVEAYSSRGPTTDGRTKPDLVAGDCGQTTVFARFCGTSQSTPHAAGAAALLSQAQPALDPAGLATALRAHTVPIGSVPNDTAGWGRLALGPAPGLAPPVLPVPPPVASRPPPLGVKAVSASGVASAWRAMAVGPSGLVHLVTSELTGGVDTAVYRRSLDGGATFATPAALSAPGLESGWAAVAASGTQVAAVWLSGDLAGVGAVAVWRSVSPDGGMTWSPPVAVSPPDGRAGDPSVAVDATGRVAVAWTDGFTGRVYLATSADGTASSQPVAVGATTLSPFTSASDLDAMPALAFGQSGQLFVAWSASDSKVVFRRSVDGGATWDPAMSIDRLADGYSRSWLAVYGSGVVIAYTARATAPGRTEVFVRRSGDGGQTFGPRRLVSASLATASFAPAVAARGPVLRVAYAQCTTSACTRARVWYRQSATYGASWSTPSALTGSTTYAWPVGLEVTSRILAAYESQASSAASRGTVYLRTR